MKTLNLVLNCALFLFGLLVAGTAILLEWRLPHGRNGPPAAFLGMGRHDWAELHWWLGLLLALGVVAHLALHWRWIWRILAKQKRAALLSVAIGTAAVLAFFALFPITPAGRNGERHNTAEQLP
jgi:hypothetical protein